jgi:hypothetical protein
VFGGPQKKAPDAGRPLAVIGKAPHTRDGAASPAEQSVSMDHAASGGSVRAARASLETLRQENESLRARISGLASARDPSDDAALRASIENLGREVTRLLGGHKDMAQDSVSRDRSLSSRKDGMAVLESANAEVPGLADAPQRRASGLDALDR